MVCVTIDDRFHILIRLMEESRDASKALVAIIAIIMIIIIIIKRARMCRCISVNNENSKSEPCKIRSG